MQWVMGFRSRIFLGLAAVVMIAAAISSSAVFESTSPGRNLDPVGGADEAINLLQSNGALLWTSLSGPVTQVRVEGWPVSDGDVELGGALVIERPEDPYAGAMNLGEPPMTASFEVGG